MRAVVLLRGVNVGGHHRLAMADLRALLHRAGARDVATYVQSGNAVVSVAPRLLATFAGRIEHALATDLGLPVRVLVRSAAELDAVIAANPFPDRALTPTRLHVAFLDDTPDPATVELVGRRHGEDELAVGDRVLYLSYARGAGESELTAPLRRLGVTMTARNWRTVVALAGLAAEPEGS